MYLNLPPILISSATAVVWPVPIVIALLPAVLAAFNPNVTLLLPSELAAEPILTEPPAFWLTLAPILTESLPALVLIPTLTDAAEA